MNNGLLLAKGIHKSYDNNGKRVKAVDGIDLQLNAGRSTAFIGPSGAGKSTLLHILGGLDRPTSGHVMLDGVDIYKLPDRERASIRNRRVGFVFQFYHLLPEFTALENVMMPEIIKNQKLKSKDRNVKERAGEALKLVGLTNRMTHRPGELSGGESQRVAIARAIINKPEVLLCDEPTGNLDSATSESVYELLFGLKESYALTLVIVTHDEKLSKRTDEVIRMKDGKINLP
ncbi:MAG: ABC transporter ATP-binding protein [Candidatus Omnitrophica bacterium]|nr:ABC transporter ATP-binding protein [Candidatus Omnitrophota bacterium]